MSTARTLLLAVAVPIVAAIVAVVTLSVTDSPSAPAAAGTNVAGGHAIVIRNFDYEPVKLVVAAGTTVKVTNADGTRHSVTADNGSFDTHDLDGGASGTVTLDKPGRYAYHCDIHDYMKGTIEVQG